jgi:hypothetical protein
MHACQLCSIGTWLLLLLLLLLLSLLTTVYVMPIPTRTHSQRNNRSKIRATYTTAWS